MRDAPYIERAEKTGYEYPYRSQVCDCCGEEVFEGQQMYEWDTGKFYCFECYLNALCDAPDEVADALMLRRITV